MVLKPNGYAFIVDPDSPQITEYDTLACAHCGGHWHIIKGTPVDQTGGFCRMCYKPVCPKCAGGDCRPFEKWLEAEEKKDYIKRQYDLMMRF